MQVVLWGTGCIPAHRGALEVSNCMEANVVSVIIVAVTIASFMLNWVILIECVFFCEARMCLSLGC